MRPNQQAYEEVVPVSSYLSRLRVLRLELCQEVPLLVVELDKLLGSSVADHHHQRVGHNIYGSVQVV